MLNPVTLNASNIAPKGMKVGSWAGEKNHTVLCIKHRYNI